MASAQRALDLVHHAVCEAASFASCQSRCNFLPQDVVSLQLDASTSEMQGRPKRKAVVLLHVNLCECLVTT